jgi:hypothetical protein
MSLTYGSVYAGGDWDGVPMWLTSMLILYYLYVVKHAQRVEVGKETRGTTPPVVMATQFAILPAST